MESLGDLVSDVSDLFAIVHVIHVLHPLLPVLRNQALFVFASFRLEHAESERGGQWIGTEFQLIGRKVLLNSGQAIFSATCFKT